MTWVLAVASQRDGFAVQNSQPQFVNEHVCLLLVGVVPAAIDGGERSSLYPRG
jgi:hypothetical protein